MKRIIIYFLGYLFLTSCSYNIDKNDINLSKFLLDSTQVFSNITDLKIDEEIYGKYGTSIKHYSISKDEFFAALDKNAEQISFFSHQHKINEGLDSKALNRKDSILSIKVNGEQITFIDINESKVNKERDYFLHGKIDNFYVVKSIQFEDGITQFINKETGLSELSIPTLNIFFNDSLMFVSDSRLFFHGGEVTVSLLSVKNNSIDTLLLTNTDWYTSFAFFDSKKPSMYYIHEKYKEDSLVSTYARMDIIQKMKNN